MNVTRREQVELGIGREISSTDESTNKRDVEEARPDLTTVVLCVITTEELDIQSILDSEAGGSLEQSAVINAMALDRVEDRYADPQLNTGVEGTGAFQRVKERVMRHISVWMVERNSDDLRFQMGAALSVLIRAKVLERNAIRLLQTTLEAEARRLMQCLLCGPHLSIV